MTQASSRIKDYVHARRHPTVVRLQDLEDDAAAGWLTESFLLTREVRNHLRAITRLLRRNTGSGVFIVGHYGSGKSHFLAYLALQLRGRALGAAAPDAVTVSLVNFSATNRLEDIVSRALGIAVTSGDRRFAWDARLAAHPHGLVLIVDELSEFLRSKSDAHAFSEDVRFLQFLGEWAQDRPFWIIAAMQEGIEHTGEIEYGLYRKIKDRYPVRLLLTPAHVQSLIADSILVKHPTYAAAVEGLCRDLRGAHPDAGLDFQTLQAIYPIHPSTLELLEEVRDRFSQARGVVDFTVTRLAGDTARGVEPFLEELFGSLITPDVIVDHFRDLLELQPEFLPLAQQVFPWYERHLGEVFDRPALRSLAEKVLKLLVLVHLSPSREALTADEATAWLLLSAARVDPERNRTVIEKVLALLAERGRYVSERGGKYRLDLRDDSGAALERLLAREVAAVEGQGALVLETVTALLPGAGFNPFQLPRNAWQHRRVAWHFHERRYAVWLGDAEPAAGAEVGICLRLPWGSATAAAGLYTVTPAPIPVSRDLIELAALARLREQPLAPELSRRVQQRLDARVHVVQQAMRSAWQEARLFAPDGAVEAAPRLETQMTFDTWLDTVALWVLRRLYPAFERFAPGHGPLPREAWVHFMRFASTEDIGLPLADDYVRLIREAYLVPMGLLRRRGADYVTPANLDRHELVRLLAPLLEHGPSPRSIHEHLAQPIYGLVPDQVNLLLVFLLLQGEIDILKDRKSYREAFETLPNPLQYDRVVPGHALGAEQVAALEHLCQELGIPTPAHWTVLTQRRCATQLADLGRRYSERLEPLVRQLGEIEAGKTLAARLQAHIDRWRSLDKGEHVLQGTEQFLFEIGSPAAFLIEVAACRDLPERLPRLLAETQRYLHLFAQPNVSRLLEATGEQLGPPPALDEPQALDHWLRRAAQLYDRHRAAYREQHEEWWRGIATHPIWSWTGPAVARSRHLELAETLNEIETCRRNAASQRCTGLVNLEYQAQCVCAFDGRSSPLAAELERFVSLREIVETRLRLFFQQERVRTRLREWQRQGVEMNVDTLSYLEGKRAVPDVVDVPSFDAFLEGVDLAAEMDVAPVLELLSQRLWRPEELLLELRRLFATPGAERLRFTGAAGGGIPAAVLEWCACQALRHGEPLPEGLTRQERAAVTQALRPEWVSAEALRRLEVLGLDGAGVDRILTWVLDGQVGLEEGTWSADSHLACVAELLRPLRISTAEELAARSTRLYRAHVRLYPLARQRWLAHLDAVAGSSLEGLASLVDVLRANLEAQWLLVDALGLPLMAALEPVLADVLSEWEADSLQFALVSTPTVTGECYGSLLAGGIEHAIEKIDVIDELVHDQAVPFADLEALACTRLATACRMLLPRLDPAQSLLVFADHGFRLSTDGRRYIHGGASTLERVVPVWRLPTRRRR
jgi:hypothetical protein